MEDFEVATLAIRALCYMVLSGTIDNPTGVLDWCASKAVALHGNNISSTTLLIFVHNQQRGAVLVLVGICSGDPAGTTPNRNCALTHIPCLRQGMPKQFMA